MLPASYYDKMIRNALRNFSKMAWSSELIEHAIKSKKLEEKIAPMPIKRAALAKKKEEEAQAVLTNQQPRGQASY